jgi:two-component system cell cycle response regulator DivK
LARILVVEDNALNIKLFCDLLAAHGHDTEAVTDSREALGVARAFHPDLVITDIQLPHVSGMELMGLLRGDPDLKDVPIMAVTAYSAQGDDERIRAAGAQAYVSKPISVAKFAQTVDGLLADARAIAAAEIETGAAAVAGTPGEEEQAGPGSSPG